MDEKKERNREIMKDKRKGVRINGYKQCQTDVSAI